MFKKKDKERYSDKQLVKMLGSNNNKAEKLLGNEKKLDKFLSKMEKKLARIPKVGKKLADIPVAVSLIRAYAKKEYKSIPAGSIIAIISTLIYFFSPADFLPDLIPFAGYLDDTALFGYMLKLINDDLDKFKFWRDSTTNTNKEDIVESTGKIIE